MSSLAAIPAPVAIYREEQLFGWWTYALMALMVGLACIFLVSRPAPGAQDGMQSSLAITVGFALPAVFVLGVLKMTVVVSAVDVDVWFGWIPTYRRQISISSISLVEVVTYNPWKDCGGWGIRMGRDGERVLNARGNRGVRLTMLDGTKLLIGSQTPEALAESIERSLSPNI